ncbi:uncharacterized protein BDFB_000236, partial [Asbolus verrucosus]
ECGDGKVSDTEELLGRLGSEDDANERLRTACTTPPLQPQDETVPTPTLTEDASTPKKQIPQHHLNFEEFSCDVSVENGDNKSGQERQEFSFTLYDFDGHGKITKDDIAGLVTTIYEALGSSVKVPHYGSKTIKVKLTVSPDQRKHVSATIINQKGNQSEEKPQETSIRYKRDLNVTIRQGTNEKRRHCRRQSKQKTLTKKHQCCNRHEEEQEQDNPFVSDDSSDACSRVSGNIASDEEEVECSENERNKPKKHLKKCQRSNSPRYTIPNLFIKDANICTENNCSKAKTLKKRSGSLQRQELLEIIQANMDKNNLGFQTPRKHSNHVSTETKQFSVESQHKHHNKTQKVSTLPLQYLANIVDPTHFYVDLASLQNTTQLPQTHCQYDKLIDAVMCVSNKKISLNKQSKCRKHRVKNDISDIPFRYQFLQYPMTNDENKMNKSNKRTPKKSVNSEVKTSKNPPVVTGHTSSPHHLRHRNRQEDQARAMAQVVRWLEQEFSSNLNTREKEKTKTNHFTQSTYKEKNTNSTPSTPNSGIERHEHHHVHEHIHHHYHHYQETPLVV